LKESTVKDADRQAIVWTPVVIGGDFPVRVAKHKINYQSNTYLNAQQFPYYLSRKLKARVLKLPLTAVGDYMKEQVDMPKFLGDEQLIAFLQ